MILFAFYAALVWYGCWRYRRRWEGVLVFGLGIFGLYFVWKLYRAIARFSHGAWDVTSMLLLFGAEAFIVIVVGGTLLAVHRDRVAVPCRKCRYELSGLEHPNPTCPECGVAHAVRPPRPGRCIACGRKTPSRATEHAVCETCEPAAKVMNGSIVKAAPPVESSAA